MATYLYNYNDQFDFELEMTPLELKAFLENPEFQGKDSDWEIAANIYGILEYALHELICIGDLEEWAYQLLSCTLYSDDKEDLRLASQVLIHIHEYVGTYNELVKSFTH